MKLMIEIPNEDYEKFKLIMIFNKTIADWNRGVKAVERHHKQYEGFQYIQESLIDNTENKAIYETYKNTLYKYMKAQEKLEAVLQHMMIELLTNYNISDCDYCNPYEYIKFKMVEVEDNE